MRKCIVKVYEKAVGAYVEKEAIFHQWGCNCIEYKDGAGNYSAAIIEYPDGQIAVLAAECVKFTEPTQIKGS